MPGGEDSAPVRLRRIEPRDDAAMAAIIRTVLREFSCAGEAASHDPEVDAMSAGYADARTRYVVIERDGRVLGGGGFAPLRGGDAATCELRKMYFLPELRGSGVGRRLLELLLADMRELGFRNCYLETMAQMDTARALYTKLGFREMTQAMGDTGHTGCDRYFLRAL